MKNSRDALFSVAVVVLGVISLAQHACAFRDVQFRSIDFDTAVIELHNFGDTAEPFTNWRFCTHDDDQVRRYSTSGALNSITLDPGESVFFYYNNDAPAGATDAFNISGLGNFATDLDQDSYAIGIYVNSSFSNAAAVVDHLQWSIDGVDNETADARSVTAVNAGLWTNEAEWISTTADTQRLELLLDDGAPISGIHGPSSYAVLEPPLPLPADLDGDDDVDSDDLGIWTSSYATDDGGDVNGNGVTDGDDFVIWQQQFTGPAGLAAATAVPKPSAIALVMLSAACLAGRRS